MDDSDNFVLTQGSLWFLDVQNYNSDVQRREVLHDLPSYPARASCDDGEFVGWLEFAQRGVIVESVP